MTDSEFHQLLDRYRKGQCTDQEMQQVERFLEENLAKPEVLHQWSPSQRARWRKELKSELLADLPPKQGKTRQLSFGRWLQIAASAVLLTSAAFWYYTGTKEEVPETVYVTKTTERGQKATVKLSDGTIVYLNAESSITFAQQFTGRSREVILTGEAFFDVTHKEEQPFVVSTGDMTTTVLGTTFNINAYPDKDNIEVTLASGAVRIDYLAARQRRSLTLSPGQQATYFLTQHRITTVDIDTALFLAWKEGIIRFDDISLKQAFEKLERWFDVEIVSSPGLNLDDCYINSKYDNETLINVLQSMQFISGLKYEMKTPSEITITDTQCQ